MQLTVSLRADIAQAIPTQWSAEVLPAKLMIGRVRVPFRFLQAARLALEGGPIPVPERVQFHPHLLGLLSIQVKEPTDYWLSPPFASD